MTTRIDRAIAIVSPERALRRARARSAFNSLTRFGAGGYEAARGTKRTLKNWWPGARSADEDTVGDLEALRSRSRDQERNDPIAGGAIGTAVTSIVGTGLRPQAQIDRSILGLGEEEAEAWERRAETIWQVAAGRLDLTRTQTFAQIQDLVLRAQLSSGDVFVLRRYKERPGDLLGLKLQVIEADRVSTPAARQSDRTIVDGVEKDGDGAPVRYWVANRHPDSLLGDPLEHVPIPAFSERGDRMALHVFHRKRPDQTRGVPFLAPVVEQLKQLCRFSEAELAAAVVASFFTVFTKTEGAQGVANQRVVADDGQEGAGSSKHDIELAPAAVVDLMPGEEIQIANPMRPNSGFDPFFLAICRQVGVGLGIPYEVLIKHFQASYSASRAAFLEAWRFFKVRRSWLASSFCQPVYEWAITEAVARGILAAPGFFSAPLVRDAWLSAVWIGDSTGQVDPTKETEAARMRIELGASTYSEVAAELTGGDWERNHERLVRETRMRREAGLDRATPAAAPAAPAPPDPDAADRGGQQ